MEGREQRSAVTALYLDALVQVVQLPLLLQGICGKQRKVNAASIKDAEGIRAVDKSTAAQGAL